MCLQLKVICANQRGHSSLITFSKGTFCFVVTEFFAKWLTICVLYRGKPPGNITSSSKLRDIIESRPQTGVGSDQATTQNEENTEPQKRKREAIEADLFSSEAVPISRQHARDLVETPECTAKGLRDLSVAVGAAVKGNLPSMIRNKQPCLEIQIGEPATAGFGNIGNNPTRILMTLTKEGDKKCDTRPRPQPYA